MKKPFDIGEMLHRIEKAVKPFPKAAMFELRDRGYTSLFEQLDFLPYFHPHVRRNDYPHFGTPFCRSPYTATTA